MIWGVCYSPVLPYALQWPYVMPLFYVLQNFMKTVLWGDFSDYHLGAIGGRSVKVKVNRFSHISARGEFPTITKRNQVSENGIRIQKREDDKMLGNIENPEVYDGKTALWFFTVHAKQDWNEVSFRRGFVRCPECYERNPESPDLHDVCSIFPANIAVPEGIGLHWCPCGTIWLTGYGEPKVLMTSDEHMMLDRKLEVNVWADRDGNLHDDDLDADWDEFVEG